MTHRVLLVVVLLLMSASAGRAQGDPCAEFAVEDGWVSLRLHRDNIPIPEARIVVLIGEGIWAEGVTGENGNASFPKPTSDSCQVTFVYTTGNSNPVPLSFIGDGVAPTRAYLTGARPVCCPLSLPPDYSQPVADTNTSMVRFWVFGVVLLVGGAVAFLAYRFTMSRMTPPNGENA